MTSRERMRCAMEPQAGRLPDRVPVMCQLAIGHYFLHAEGGAVEIWHDSDAFARALVTLQQRYGFDGILVNLPGRDHAWRRHVAAIEDRDGEQIVRWRGRSFTVAPPDDNPHVYRDETGERFFPAFSDIDPAQLFYVEPHDLSGITWPWTWGFEDTPARPGPDFFPPWHEDTIRRVRGLVPDVSVHAEVFSPFSQLLELLDVTNGLMALVDDAPKVLDCLERLAEGTIELACAHFAAGADAVLISSAFAGAGLISRRQYEAFVLPIERRVTQGIRRRVPGAILYTHTCGAIGDRLDLMEATGTGGIDTLDPPPLGTVDLAAAKRQLGSRVFIKGNIDPVNTVLCGTPESCHADARARLAIGMPGGGYILSTACSVPPHAPPENIRQLRRAAEEAGRYRMSDRPDQG